MGSTTLTKPETAPQNGGGTGPGGHGSDGFSGEGGWGGHEWSVPARTYRTGLWIGLGAIVMLFASFTSALIVRRGISNDWAPTALPRVLFVNTMVLMMSSLTLELARKSLAAGLSGRFLRCMYATFVLGLLFIGGQLLAWRELAARGVYLATNPSSSFFYLLTAAHGVHLLGGTVALGYLIVRSRELARTRMKRVAVDVTAIYWHFMDGLWIYILLLLMVRL
jgi:cytochrome c oxidase subunit 3